MNNVRPLFTKKKMMSSYTKIYLVVIAICIGGHDQAMGRDLAIILNGIEMNNFDYRMVNNAYEFSPSGQVTSWDNINSGNHYSISPQPAFSDNRANQPCRKAEITASIGYRTEQVETIACRDNTANWIIQKISSRKNIAQQQSVTPAESKVTSLPSGHSTSGETTHQNKPTSQLQSPPTQKKHQRKWSKPVE